MASRRYLLRTGKRGWVEGQRAMSELELPAVLGGAKACSEPAPEWPPRTEAVCESLQRAWQQGDWGRYSGQFTERLRAELAGRFGFRYVVTCSSGTLAVELALRAAGVRSGDEVILAAYDYPGNLLSVQALGARAVLVDVHPQDWNLDAEQLASAVGPATRAILVSHLHGSFVPMPQVQQLASRRGVAIVEDIAQVPGGRVAGRLAGTWAGLAALSFGGSKLLTAGRGGAVLTNDRLMYQRLCLATQRYNELYALSELQAAALLPQLDRLEEWNRRRAANAGRLMELLGQLPGLEPIGCRCPDSAPCYYKLGIKFDGAELAGLRREEFIESARAEGVELAPGFPAAHLSRSPSRFRAVGPLPNAGQAHERLTLLHHPVLLGDERQVDQVAEAFRKVCNHASRIVEKLRGSNNA